MMCHQKNIPLCITVFSAVLFLVFSLILLREYHFLTTQIVELQTIKEKYYAYSNELEKRIQKRETCDESKEQHNTCDDVSEDSIVMNNITFNCTHDDSAEMPVYHNMPVLQTSITTQQSMPTTKSSTTDILQKKKDAQKIQNKKHKMMPTRTIKKKDYGLIWPIDQEMFWLSSRFGPRKRINGAWGFHHGIDMAAVRGTVVKAARNGTIMEAGFQEGYGNTVLIRHDASIKTRYAHLQSIHVYKGQLVKQGALIGTVGDTGFVRRKSKDGSHLHFEVYEGNTRINPLICLASHA